MVNGYNKNFFLNGLNDAFLVEDRMLTSGKLSSVAFVVVFGSLATCSGTPLCSLCLHFSTGSLL